MSERPSAWGTLPEDGTTLTTAEYLQTAESVRVQELIYGRLCVEESPTPMHQALLLRLAMILDEHARNNKVGSIWIAPLDVILDASRALVVQPDLFFVNIYFLHVINQFLLHSVIVNIFFAYMFFKQQIYFVLNSFFAVGFQF